MLAIRQRKLILNILVNILVFIVGCSITLSLTSVEKSCTRDQNHLSVHDKQTSGENEIFLVVLILSAPNNIARRDTLRNTWLRINLQNLDPDPSTAAIAKEFHYNENGFLAQDTVHEQRAELERFQQQMLRSDDEKKKSPHHVRVKILHYFAIGTASLPHNVHSNLLTESETHKDLMLLNDLTDSYENLTKKMLRTIETLNRMSSFRYLLKVDDDTYVKLDLFLEELLTYDRLVREHTNSLAHPKPELYWGYFNGRANIQQSGQWKENDFQLSERYLPYALGGGYVISRNLITLLATNAHLLNAYVSEDMSMGVWLSPYRHIYRKHDVRFDTGYMPRACQRHHIVLHKRTVTDMFNLKSNLLCTFKRANDTSMRRPKEYFYDWARLPMKCCDTLL